MAHSAILEAISATATTATTEQTRLVLLLAVNNADKAPKPASFPQRLGMMDALGHALRRQLIMEEVDVEIDLAVTTMPYFHKKAAAIEESEFYKVDETVPEQQKLFLAGFDTVIRIFNPKYYTEVAEESISPMKSALGPFFDGARLRVTMRPDDEWGSEEEQMAYVRGLEEGKLDEVGGDGAWAKRIELVKGEDGVGVSSSKVRSMAEQAGETRLEELVGEDVKEWIEKEGLYRKAG
jgi:nicotinamide-nucleotide adenylyltransferase